MQTIQAEMLPPCSTTESKKPAPYYQKLVETGRRTFESYSTLETGIRALKANGQNEEANSASKLLKDYTQEYRFLNAQKLNANSKAIKLAGGIADYWPMHELVNYKISILPGAD